MFLALSAGHLAETTPESRAIQFLIREVPAWSKNNGCFSCHNNGDAARALYAAARVGYKIPEKALADTTVWLATPAIWDTNKGDPGFSDKRLANIQFAASLVAAIDAGRTSSEKSKIIEEAAQKIIADQDANGAWSVDVSNTTGSPATYGTTLATAMALKTLRRSRSPGARKAGEAASAWLARLTPTNVPIAAAITLSGLRSERASIDFILRSQSREGGWGPYPDAPSEAFDTALALLALAASPRDLTIREAIKRGRAFLRSIQTLDGSWPATTRPTGGESYAQMISTTGWATLALLETRGM